MVTLRRNYMKFPKLKYIEDSSDVYEYSKEGKICQCCGKKANFYTTMIYCDDDIDVICQDCVVSGRACEKFDGYFNESEESGNFMAKDEVEICTPTLPTYQEVVWPACCNNYCKYLRRFTKEDSKNETIMKSLEKTFDDEFVPFEDLKNYKGDYVILFKCEECGEYYAIVDMD